jgi:hypothetical protein
MCIGGGIVCGDDTLERRQGQGWVEGSTAPSQIEAFEGFRVIILDFFKNLKPGGSSRTRVNLVN